MACRVIGAATHRFVAVHVMILTIWNRVKPARMKGMAFAESTQCQQTTASGAVASVWPRKHMPNNWVRTDTAVVTEGLSIAGKKLSVVALHYYRLFLMPMAGNTVYQLADFQHGLVVSSLDQTYSVEAFSNSLASEARNSTLLALTVSSLFITTMSVPARRSLPCLNVSLTMRFNRFRSTARLARFFATARPIRAVACSFRKTSIVQYRSERRLFLPNTAE